MIHPLYKQHIWPQCSSLSPFKTYDLFPACICPGSKRWAPHDAAKRTESSLYMKKQIVSALMILALIVSLLPTFSFPAHAASYSGSCGDSLSWSLDTSTGVLLIEGSGEMYDFRSPYQGLSFPLPPWYDSSSSIRSVVLSPGITKIGSSAFYNCTNLTNVTIPEASAWDRPAIELRSSASSGPRKESLSPRPRRIPSRMCRKRITITRPCSGR